MASRRKHIVLECPVWSPQDLEKIELYFESIEAEVARLMDTAHRLRKLAAVLKEIVVEDNIQEDCGERDHA